jgi:hypothetical protein
MPIDMPETLAPVTAASAVGAVTGLPISSIAGGAAAQKKMAELGFKKTKEDEFDPTDNDPSFIYNIVECAIKNGASVKEIDIEKIIPAFQEEAKTRAKKYQTQKVIGFFTGSGFMFMMYMLFEYLKTLGG